MDNDHVESKIALRLLAIEKLGGEPRTLHVLDAYHGHGKLWATIAERLPDGWEVDVYRVDKERRAIGTLKLDNVRLLSSIRLDRFDLIDLDAFGWPTKQLRIVSERAPKTPVLTTRITRALGQFPREILRDLRFEIPEGAPGSLYVTLGDELWEAWLYHLGYRTSIMYRFDHQNDPRWSDTTQQIKRYELLIP